MLVLKTLIIILSRAFTQIVFIISMYYLCISFFGIYKKNDNKKFAPQKKFALIVAAHNEELVIQDIVYSLKELKYPNDLYDIFVIADNCDDDTALKAKNAGANVFVRFDKDKRGKGYALEWMFNIIFNMRKKYDAVCVFDADNLVSKQFLTEMNKKLCEGYKVIQGYLDSKNPKDSWITGSYSIAFWTSNRMFQLSRKNLGLSSQLGGTGFCVDTEILKKLGWGATCLTEDLEFSCKLVLNGYKVGWAHEAIIYDEKPLTLKQSWNQRKRWMQGFADVSSRYFLKLLKRFILKFDFKALDCALYSIQPIIIVLLGISALISAGKYVMNAYNVITNFDTVVYSVNSNMVTITVIILGILQYIYTPFILILDDKLDLKIFWYYILYPIYTITWLPISIQGIINKNNKNWDHTHHSRSIKISDLEKAN